MGKNIIQHHQRHNIGQHNNFFNDSKKPEEAILSAENSGKPLGGWRLGSARNPAGELTALPDPLAGAQGVAAPPMSFTTTLGLDFRPFPPNLHFPQGSE